MIVQDLPATPVVQGLGVAAKPANPPFISMVVPAYNEEKLIGETLRSIFQAAGAFAERGWPYEMVVCDNNSTDQTAAIARAAGATVVFEPINQIGRARNSGAASARGNWLLFIDADSEPSHGLLTAVAAEIATGTCLAGGATIQMACATRSARLAVSLWNWISKRGKLLAGSFIFCEAVAFRTVGGFNAELFAGEELDLTRKLKRVARESAKRLVILEGHPLRTSPRKVLIYSNWEHARFALNTLFSLGATLRRRDACHTWYDGRR